MPLQCSTFFTDLTVKVYPKLLGNLMSNFKETVTTLYNMTVQWKPYKDKINVTHDTLYRHKSTGIFSWKSRR